MRFTSIRLSLWLVGLLVGLSSQLAQAQVAVPSEGGEISVTYINSTTMELEFGMTGTGQGRVVAIGVALGGIPIRLAAANEQFYKAAPTYAQGDTLGDGYVVYNGTGHTVTVTGLKPNTSYHIANSEYNTDGTTILYNTYGTSTILSTPRAAAPTPLPVELTSFTGTVNAESLATLRWTTASERNTAYFALERSTDGTIFKEAGRVDANGTSSETRAYQWPDPQRLGCPTYYRLRQADHDGTVYYSGVVTLVPIQAAVRVVEVYPNPSTGQTINLLLQGYDGEKLSLRLSDALGRSVMTQVLTPAAARYTTPLAVPQGLAAGTYVLTLLGSNTPVKKHIVVSN